MSTVEQAVQTQLTNIQKKTGKSLVELADIIRKSGLTKHGEIREMLKNKHGLGHGDANTLVHAILQSDGTRAAEGKTIEELLGEIYSGAKAPLRPIHDAVMHEVDKLGDFEIAPKKGYLSLRRKKQFAMLGPGGKGRVELGLNGKDLPPAERLLEQPKGSMCNYNVILTDVTQVDAELIAWLQSAYQGAG